MKKLVMFRENVSRFEQVRTARRIATVQTNTQMNTYSKGECRVQAYDVVAFVFVETPI